MPAPLLPQIIMRERVPYVTTGKNVAVDHINIRCPFCGKADPSEHMGICLSTGVWGCWRDSQHRGKRPHRLLHRLFGWPWDEIDAMCSTSLHDRSSIRDSVMQALDGANSLIKPPALHKVPAKVCLPPSVYPLRPSSRLVAPFVNYIIGRGIDADEVWDFIAEYEIHAALVGPQAYRIVFPIRNDMGALQTWTGRTVGTSVSPRYVSGSGDLSVPIKDCLFNEYKLYESNGAEVLVVTEGPWDAMKIDWYGKMFGVRATCVFGSFVSDVQTHRIVGLSHLFGELLCALDPENLHGTLITAGRIGAVPKLCPSEDFGAMSRREVERWCESFSVSK